MADDSNSNAAAVVAVPSEADAHPEEELVPSAAPPASTLAEDPGAQPTPYEEEEEEEEDLVPFANRVPTNREERNAALDKTSLEKHRLAARRGGHYRYDGVSNPLAVDESAPGYLPESERFLRDVASQQRDERLQTLVSRETRVDARREKLFNREEARWDKMEAEYTKTANELDNLKLRPVANRNKASVAYNITNLQYDDTDEGRGLQYNDDCVKYRANLRANELYAKGSGDGFDIFTGQAINPERRPLGPKPVLRADE